MASNATKQSVYIPVVEFFSREHWYKELFHDFSDPRTRDFFLLQSPEKMLSIVGMYLVTVPLLMRFMQSRKGLNLRSVIFLYNFILVGLSGYMCYEFLVVALKLGYSFTCQPLDWDYKRDVLSIRMVNVSWLFFFSKIIELADTMFFILRKKTNQVTFLHVYHHATMVINWWMACKYVPVGQSFFVGVVNSFIHTLMYAYYALACMGPGMHKYLWWKKYMTSMQLVQFLLVVSHTGNSLYFNTSCDFPWLYNFITFYYSWSMMFLFLNFYYHAYLSSKPPSKAFSATSPIPSKHHLSNGTLQNGVASTGHLNGDLTRRRLGDGQTKE